MRIALVTARAYGLDPETCLAGTGITDPNAAVDEAQERAVARNLIAGAGDLPGLGAQTGLKYTVASLGVLGLALLSSATLRDAARTGTRYLPLASAFVVPSMSVRDGHAHVDFDDSTLDTDVRDFLVERDIASILAIVPLMIGDIPAHRTPLALSTRLSPICCEKLAELLPHVGSATPEPGIG